MSLQESRSWSHIDVYTNSFSEQALNENHTHKKIDVLQESESQESH